MANTATPLDTDVLVIGAGPTGLLLACELRLAGADVIVLERLSEPDTTIKAGAVNTPTSIAFDRRGLAPAAAAAQQESFARMAEFMRKQFGEAAAGSPEKRTPPKFAGHFGAIMMTRDLFDESDPDFAGHGPAAEIGFLQQEQVERILGDRAAQLGVDVRRGVGFEGYTEDEDSVTVRTATGSLRAAWLVGADGGRSRVRKQAGFDFPGTDPEITGHQAIVTMTGAEGLNGGWNVTETGIYVNGPIPGRILTVEFDGPPADRDAPITARELQDSLRAVSGVDVTITEVHSATRFTDNARQATDYRKGRVLLAGDAAHVHSPFGGQGLNLGIGDAFNLGWKLAAVVDGRAPAGLLDTYTAERHPIGAWVLEWTRAQIAIMRPEPHARALRSIVTDLIDTTVGTTYFVKKISGVWQRYDLGSEHPLVGASAPDLPLSDGSLLNDHLHSGLGLLLDLSDDPRLRELAAGYGDRVKTVTASSPEAKDGALLLRPDGVVAWAADTAEGLAEALSTWFGAPA